MLRLCFRNLLRRPWHNGLGASGLAIAVAALACLLALTDGYEQGLRRELDTMGLQMMLVPLGCPYDAAAHVLKGKTLENSLPENLLAEVRRDPAVAVAAPLLIAATPARRDGRSDIWIGLDESALALKPWWRAGSGLHWFGNDDSVILGHDAAEAELRAPGDLLFSPEAGRSLRVAGVLECSGTSDDSGFFVPLRTAQAMCEQRGRLTAIAIRLRDPLLVRETAARLQQLPGAQVVTSTEMMGTFLNLVSAVRRLCGSLALLAVVISALGILNTLLGAVLDRTPELSVLRALGASRAHLFGLLALEGLLLTLIGSAVGLLLAAAGGPVLDPLVRNLVPFAPPPPLLRIGLGTLCECTALSIMTGLAAGLYPAWRAGRIQPALALKLPCQNTLSL